MLQARLGSCLLHLGVSFAIFSQLIAAQRFSSAPAPAPSGTSLQVEDTTVYFVHATCNGTGVWSGEGTAEATGTGLNVFTSTSGLEFDGEGFVNSTSGIWRGTGTCEGDAEFNITSRAPGTIVGDGTVTGTGTFDLPTGPYEGEGTFSGQNISFSDGAGSFDGENTNFDGTGSLSGSRFTCFGDGSYSGTGEVNGTGTTTGTFIFRGEGSFAGVGVFRGSGICTGDPGSFISNSRTEAVANGFPDAVTLTHPSSTAGPAAASS